MFNDTNPYARCHLCPRGCGANRLAGHNGFCGETATLRLGTVAVHFGEEPSITGKRGSGTVFFSGCSCKCFFCQNHQISQGEQIGHPRTEEELLNDLHSLIDKGVHNLNFVTGDHYWPTILKICRTLRKEGCTLPFLWNCSGYETVESIRAISEVMDIFLPDFKFMNPDLAEMCMGDRRYPQIACEAIAEMVERKGLLRPWDTTGELTASTGTMVRHLVLPGQVRNSLTVLDFLREAFGPRLPLSLMSQFMPMPECKRRGFLDKRLTEEEFQRVREHAEELGFEHVYFQLGLGDDRFAPDFTKENPFPSI